MHQGQAQRYFPLPDYDLSIVNSVKLTIYGKIVDPAYSRTLIKHGELILSEIIALDRIQKKLSIDSDIAQKLKRAKLIEGRKPHFHISSKVAAVTDKKVEYINTRAQDDEHYIRLILNYLQQFNSATRSDFNKLLLDKLSDALSEKQKLAKIGNLLTKMKKNGTILTSGPKMKANWTLNNR